MKQTAENKTKDTFQTFHTQQNKDRFTKKTLQILMSGHAHLDFEKLQMFTGYARPLQTDQLDALTNHSKFSENNAKKAPLLPLIQLPAN